MFSALVTMFLGGLGLLSLAVLQVASGSHASESQSVLGLKQPTANSAKAYAQSAYSVSYDDGLFTPVEHLGVLSVDSFTTLGHPYFPNHSVRIKKTDFCDGTVKSVGTSILLTWSHPTEGSPAFQCLHGLYRHRSSTHFFLFFRESQ